MHVYHSQAYKKKAPSTTMCTAYSFLEERRKKTSLRMSDLARLIKGKAQVVADFSNLAALKEVQTIHRLVVMLQPD